MSFFDKINHTGSKYNTYIDFTHTCTCTSCINKYIIAYIQCTYINTYIHTCIHRPRKVLPVLYMCPISNSHQLFEKYLEKQSENIHWTYLDFKEGFDSVNRDSAWQLYNKMCLPTTFVDLLRVFSLCYAIKLLIKTYRILSPSLA